MTRTRIAILGGGPAAMATAFELTRTPELRARYEVDLYQIGWRPRRQLDAPPAATAPRAAATRSTACTCWSGFYHNVFDQLRPLYAEWAEVSPATAIPFEQAFRGHNRFTLMQPDGDSWRAPFASNCRRTI